MKHHLTKHHILPRSHNGSNEKQNIKMLKDNIHRAFHLVFDNLTPPEQIAKLMLSINWTALTDEFKNDIMKILKETDNQYYYKNGILVPNSLDNNLQ